MNERLRDPVRVCVVGSGWRFTSGISYYTCRLATALASHSTVSVVLMRQLIPRRLYPGRDRVGVPVNDIDYPDNMAVFDGIDWYLLPSMLRAIRFLRQEQPEILLLQWWTGAVLHSYLLLVIAARRMDTRVVIEFHEVQDTGEARLRGAARYARAMASWVLRRADAYLVHSQHDLEAVRDAYPPARLPTRVIPHGPFDQHVGDGSAKTPARDDDGSMTVMFFGTIRPYKGLENLVRAFDRLDPADAEKFRLLIVGETWEGWTQPITEARHSRFHDRIEIVNTYVDDAAVGRYFARADAVVLPYLRSSASGPLHIAMAHGLPIVLSDVGGLRDGAAGYEGITWVPPGDPAALGDALRDLPAVRGRRFADPRSWDHTVEVLDELFTDVLPG